MKRHNADSVQSHPPPKHQSWADLDLQPPWEEIAPKLAKAGAPRPIQSLCLGEMRILESRKNLIVSAPTNGGKSLVGTMFLLDAIQRGGRALLLEPLRALAQEQHDHLQSLKAPLSETLQKDMAIEITTGDYRLSHEKFSDAPPEDAQLVVATPERLDAILRQPDFESWIKHINAVCVDEAHLLSDQNRGPALESVITTLLSLPAPPRIMLLSATIGINDDVVAWLKPCDVAQVTFRDPPLSKTVIELEGDETLDAITSELVLETLLSDPQASILVFVDRTSSASRLADTLSAKIAEAKLSAEARPYHAKLSPSVRRNIEKAFRKGEVRCLVTTSALSMGVNLPATTTIIRDITRFRTKGTARMSVSELLQMAGRAGRGDQAGSAFILRHSEAHYPVDELVKDLVDERIPSLSSAFTTADTDRYDQGSGIESVAELVLSQLVRASKTGRTKEELETFFSSSLGGRSLSTKVRDALTWLSQPDRVLAHQGEELRFRATRLGREGASAKLPLELISGVGQLIRDLLQVDSSDRVLEQWQPLDHLLLLELCNPQSPNLRRFNQALPSQVEAWMEGHAKDRSILYRRWIYGTPEKTQAEELLGSLGLNKSRGADSTASYKPAILATLRAILLFERARGTTASDLNRRWQVPDLEGVEEKWRDAMLWLLGGYTRMLDVRCFFYHLREECKADDERIKRVTQQFRRLKLQAFELQECLTYCSPLGAMLRRLRSSRQNRASPTVGIRTIRILEDHGFDSILSLRGKSIDDLTSLGLQRRFAQQIVHYVQRRTVA